MSETPPFYLKIPIDQIGEALGLSPIDVKIQLLNAFARAAKSKGSDYYTLSQDMYWHKDLSDDARYLFGTMNDID